MISEGIACALNDSAQGVLVDGVPKAGADVLTEALTNGEATEILRGANSGLKPDLSRRGYRFVKRVFDIVASSAAIAVLLVPGVILSIVIYALFPAARGQAAQGRHLQAFPHVEVPLYGAQCRRDARRPARQE